MRWREWLGLSGAVVVALALGAVGHELSRTTPSAAERAAEVEVLGAVLEADPPDTDLAAVEQRVRAAVLAVEVDACGGRRRASATLVRGMGTSARVVTNVHVVRGATRVQLSDVVGGAPRGPAQLDGRWPGRDLAHLDAERAVELGSRSLPVGPDPQVGDPVLVVGHPDGHQRADSGVVRSVELRSTDGVTSPAVIVSTPASGGHSGGAVVDTDGQLVAIVAARDPLTGETVAHPASALGAARVDLPSTC